jgi:hypothetical protein
MFLVCVRVRVDCLALRGLNSAPLQQLAPGAKPLLRLLLLYICFTYAPHIVTGARCSGAR